MAETNVIIANKLGQRLPVSVLDDTGKPTEVAIPPHGTHGPIPESKVGAYTRKLARLGHVKIRRAK